MAFKSYPSIVTETPFQFKDCMQPVSHLGTRGVTSLPDLGGCPWQGATPTPGSLLPVALGEGLHSASPNGLCGLPSGSFAGADVWSLLFERGPAGEGCYLDRVCLDALPPVAICSVYAEPWQSAGLGHLALLYFAKTSPLTKRMTRPRSFPPSFLAEGKAPLSACGAGYHAHSGPIQVSNLDLL